MKRLGSILLVLCLVGAFQVPAAMTSTNAVFCLLNSQNAVRVRTFEEAKAIVERDAAAKQPLQQFVIGITTDDKALAKKYIDAARPQVLAMAEKGNDPLAWYLLAVEKNDLRLLRRAADGGNVQALNALGTIATQDALSRSKGSSNDVQRILSESYGWFRRAAAKRDPNGFINLGTCYLHGYGCKRDLTMAFSCFMAAAEMGHPAGMDNVSACYQFGHGVRKNDALSLLWAMRGRAARGDEAAAKWLRERK